MASSNRNVFVLNSIVLLFFFASKNKRPVLNLSLALNIAFIFLHQKHISKHFPSLLNTFARSYLRFVIHHVLYFLPDFR